MASVIVTGAVVVSCTSETPAPPDALATSTETSALLAAPGWSATASMSQARGQHAAVLLPTGKLLVVNGIGPSGRVTTAELYDLDTDTWTDAGAPGISGDVGMAVVLPNGNALVLNSTSGRGAVYDPIARTWTSTARWRPCASLRR